MVAEPTVERQLPQPAPRTGRSRAANVRVNQPLARPRTGGISPLAVLVVAVGLVVAGQVVEDLSDSQPLHLLNPTAALRRWTLIVAVLYSLSISMVIDRMVATS